jgi:predicted amidohydrolase
MQITIAVVQLRPILGDPVANVKKALDFLGRTKTDVAVLPELFTTGYTFVDPADIAPVSIAPDDPILAPIYEFSARRSMGIAGGYAERGGDRRYNSSFFIGDGKLISNYRKTHLFSYEKELFSPGDTGFSVFAYKGARFGMMICFDWIFPEAARTLAMLGADVILHPANLVLPFCQRAMFARAVENRVFTVTANRVGTERSGGHENQFTGGSVIVSPAGEYLLEMDGVSERVETRSIDPVLARDKEITPLNDLLADRRPEFYK